MLIKEALSHGFKLLNNHLEARILLANAIGGSQEYLIGHSDEGLSTKIVNKFYEFIERRVMKEPIAYIIGSKEFYARDFIVDSNVLIPRNDSEVLIDAVLINKPQSSSSLTREPNCHPGILYNKTSGIHYGKMDSCLRGDYTSVGPQLEYDEYRILELGVGSGCLLLTLLLELQNAYGVGVDISKAALEVARRNMLKYDLSERCTLIQSNWFDKVNDKFDIIISNPPYISENDIHMMAEETKLYEPKSALYADKNGYAAYEIIAENLKNFLKPGGSIYIEIGINQEAEIERIFKIADYHVTGQYKDLSGIIRVLKLT